MKIYQLNEDLIWDGIVREARPDPITEGEWLIPRLCAIDAPPSLAANQVARKVGDVNGPWEVIADFRGLTYWLSDRSSHTISVVGISPPSGYLVSDPGPSLEDNKNFKVAIVKAQIAQLECDQARSTREVLLALAKGQVLPAMSVSKLQAYEDQIVALRIKLAALAAAATQAELDAINI